MNIVITQRQTTINNIVYDCLDPDWYRFLDQHTIIPMPNIVDVDFNADLLILSGGNDTNARLATEQNCYDIAVSKNIPIIGICRGAFMLNQLYNGANRPLDGHRNVDHIIEMEGETFTVNSYHDMGIYLIGDDIEVIADSEDGIEAFKHATLPHWGIVWHPERMLDPVLPKDLKDLLNG